MTKEGFISYYPLKQGLKQPIEISANEIKIIYILLSIKTRIETSFSFATSSATLYLYPTIH